MHNHINSKGYSLVELMIAITLGLFLVAAASGTYIVQNRSFTAQESVTEINTQAKIALDRIAHELRSTGVGAPDDLNEEPINGVTSLIVPFDRTSESDAITIVGGFRSIGTLWPAGTAPGLACPASVGMGTSQVSLLYSGTEAPNMSNKRYLSIDSMEFVEVQSCTPDPSDCAPGIVTLDRTLSQDFPLTDLDGNDQCDSGRPVYLVEDATFCIDENSTLRRISRNAEPGTCPAEATMDNKAIAENIDDFQIAYAVDLDDDGFADDQNANGTFDNEDFLDGSDVADPDKIRAIRINILARSDRAAPDFTGLGNPPEVIENRNHSATNDGFRRRWWQTVVSMRNE